MHQVATHYWNEIARTQKLQTKWAKFRFPLDEDELADQLEVDAETMLAHGNSTAAVLSFLTLWPLLAEQEAISRYLKQHPAMRHALPEILDIDEALALAEMDRPLSNQERIQLDALLSEAMDEEGLDS